MTKSSYKHLFISSHEIDDALWDSIKPYLPSQKPHTERFHADLRKLISGILYVVTTGCTRKDVSRQYGSKSTVHRFHLYLCENRIYQEIFNELLKKGCNLKKIDLPHCFTYTKDIPAKKGETSVMMTTRR